MANADKDLESEYNGRKNVNCKCEYDSEDEFDNNTTCKRNKKDLTSVWSVLFLCSSHCFKYIYWNMILYHLKKLELIVGCLMF